MQNQTERIDHYATLANNSHCPQTVAEQSLFSSVRAVLVRVVSSSHIHTHTIYPAAIRFGLTLSGRREIYLFFISKLLPLFRSIFSYFFLHFDWGRIWLLSRNANKRQLKGDGRQIKRTKKTNTEVGNIMWYSLQSNGNRPTSRELSYYEKYNYIFLSVGSRLDPLLLHRRIPLHIWTLRKKKPEQIEGDGKRERRTICENNWNEYLSIISFVTHDMAMKRYIKKGICGLYFIHYAHVFIPCSWYVKWVFLFLLFFVIDATHLNTQLNIFVRNRFIRMRCAFPW